VQSPSTSWPSRTCSRTFNAAQIVIASLPVILIYPFLQQYFVRGLTLGSIKG
jgi:putative aldouronate transport system permease protein